MIEIKNWIEDIVEKIFFKLIEKWFDLFALNDRITAIQTQFYQNDSAIF